MRLAGHPEPNVLGRTFVLILLVWVPLLALSLGQGTAFGDKVKVPLLGDFTVYARFLAAIPLLLAAEIVIDPWIRRVVLMFETSGILKEDDLPAHHAELRAIIRLRDSGLAALLLGVLAAFPFFLVAEGGWVSGGISTWHGSASGGLAAAGWWFAFVSSPIIRFLLLRWLWRYFLWSLLLLRMTRLNLQMLPTRPDRFGGLGFVVNAQRHFGILAMAIGSIVAGQYANLITYFGASIASARGPVVFFVVFSILIILSPLLTLCPKLFETRRNGLVAYGRAARRLATAFDAKSISDADPREDNVRNHGSPCLVIRIRPLLSIT